MERIHMNTNTEIIYRLRAKERIETISRDIDISHLTVQ
jgi:hypothetical protein